MKKLILSMMLAAVAVCGWAANDSKTLKVKLDIVDFGDTVVVYRTGLPEQTFIGKNGKFEFEIEVDEVCMGILLQPKALRGDMDDLRVYNIPMVGGEEVRLVDKDKTRYDVEGTGFYADYHKVDLFNENDEKEMHEATLKYRAMKADDSVSKEERDKYYNEVYSPSFDRHQQAVIDYIKAHAKQEASIMLLREISGLDKMKEAYMLTKLMEQSKLKEIRPSIREEVNSMTYEY